MKKRFLSLVLALALAIGCTSIVAAAAVPYMGDRVSVTCNSATGTTNTFDVHEKGRVRFYVWNDDGEEAVTLTVQKKGLIFWNDVTVNGADSFEVPAEDSKLFDTDGSDWSKGTYRFTATNVNGTPFAYTVDIRELDYNP